MGTKTWPLRVRLKGWEVGTLFALRVGITAVAGSEVRGWRGNGTGVFWEVTPPTRWQRVAVRTCALQTQAQRPVGEAEAPAVSVAIPVTAWLVAGPFTAAGGKAALSNEVVAGEADLRPDANETVGDTKWRPAPMLGHWVDLGAAMGCTEEVRPEPWKIPASVTVALLHCYVFAREEGQAVLHLTANSGVRAFFNGRSVIHQPERGDVFRVQVDLQRGWNRLLVKTWGATRTWGVGAWLWTLPPKPLRYEEENLVWKTPMPRGASSPTVVGDLVAVGFDPMGLAAYDKASGRLRWMKFLTYYDAASEEDRAAVRDRIEPLLASWHRLNEELVARTLGPQADTNFDDWAMGQKRWKLMQEVNGILRELHPKRYATDRCDWEYASATPVTDGKRLYMWFSNRVAACLDLNGRLIWIRMEPLEGGGSHHGRHASPVLVGDRLITAYGRTLQAFDTASGTVLWRAKAEPARGATEYGSLLAARAGGRDVVITCHGQGFSAEDGTVCWRPWSGFRGENTTPVVADDSIFFYDRAGIFHMRFPKTLGSEATLERVGAVAYPNPYVDYMVASPLYHEGLLYCVNDRGLLRVYDTASGRIASQQWLPLRPAIQYVAAPGVAASPALAGGFLYVLDNQGNTAVLRPGIRPEVVAVNPIEHLNPAQPLLNDQTVSNLAFDGTRIYLRSQQFLYCIEAPRR